MKYCHPVHPPALGPLQSLHPVGLPRNPATRAVTRAWVHRIGAIAILLGAAASAGGTAAAASILVPGPYRGATQILQGSPIGQTFVAEDASIQSIGFSVRDLNPETGPSDFTLRLSLYAGAGTTGSLLGSGDFGTLSPGYRGFIDVDFSFVALKPGETYTAIIMDSTPRWGLETADSPEAYSAGAPVLLGIPQPDHADGAFRVTAVPEPSVVAMVCTGALCLLALSPRNGSDHRR